MRGYYLHPSRHVAVRCERGVGGGELRGWLAADADDIHLVGRVVESPVQGPVVADGADHDDLVRRHLTAAALT